MNSAADPRPLAICLMGPTACGKTALALGLSEALDCELVSVDSAQVYRGMDIGTAKPDAQTLARYPHHLIDIRDPVQSYSAAEFRADALEAIEAIVAAGKTPLLVGGTMLYFRALLHGLAGLPAASETVRAEIAEQVSREGWEAVHRRLREVDPLAAARIRPSDPQRLQRALEVYLLTGQSISSIHQRQETPRLPCRLLQLGLVPHDRGFLHQQIARRFEQMLEQGFIEEVRTLRARGDLNPALPSMRSVGYRQAWEFLDGHLTYAGMRERAIIATRQLAKRQLTWLRSWPELHLLQPTAGADVRDLLPKALKLVSAAAI